MTVNSTAISRILTAFNSRGGSGSLVVRLVLVAAVLMLNSLAHARTIYYHGVIAPPVYKESRPHYGNAVGGLTYSDNCFGHADPSAEDGFAGCLGMIGNARHAPVQFGSFSIEKPVTVEVAKRDTRHLPKSVQQGKVVIPLTDPSTDSSGQSIYQSLSAIAPDQGWKNRELSGVAVLRDGSVLHTCARDWYNVGQKTFPSHCLATFKDEKASASGPFTFRCPPAYKDLCHTEMVGAYVGSITDQAYADRVFAKNGFSKPGDLSLIHI